MPRRRSRGRPSNGSDTRSAIIAVARARFAANGYAGTTIRAVAGLASVDPALVHHYFQTKRELYAAVMADGEAGLEPSVATNRDRVSSRSSEGERLVTTALEAWDRPETAAALAALAALVRSAASDAPARARFDALVRDAIAGPVAAGLDRSRVLTRVRSALVAAQLVGLAWARYVARTEPLATTSVRTLARIYGAAIDAILSGSDYGAT